MFEKLRKLAQADTPKVGKRLAGLSVGIGAAGYGLQTGIQFYKPEIIEFLPEQHRTVYMLVTATLDALPYIMYALAAVIYGAGQFSTVGNPDEIVDQK